jgi:hypothetical protein
VYLTAVVPNIASVTSRCSAKLPTLKRLQQGACRARSQYIGRLSRCTWRPKDCAVLNLAGG